MKIPNDLICQKIPYLFLKFNLSGINEARNIHYCIDFRCPVSGQFYLCRVKSLNWQREFSGLHLFLNYDLNYSLGNTCNTYNVILLNLNCVFGRFFFHIFSPQPQSKLNGMECQTTLLDPGESICGLPVENYVVFVVFGYWACWPDTGQHRRSRHLSSHGIQIQLTSIS